jgi:hypothetical protein
MEESMKIVLKLFILKVTVENCVKYAPCGENEETEIVASYTDLGDDIFIRPLALRDVFKSLKSFQPSCTEDMRKEFDKFCSI